MITLDHNDPSFVTEKILQLCPKNSRILELGCGDGRNLRKLKEMGFDCLSGLDRDESKVAIARAALGAAVPIECSDIRNLKLNEKYDVIFHVLVGIFLTPEDREELFKKLQTYIRPGGYYLFEEIARDQARKLGTAPYFYSKSEIAKLDNYFQKISVEEVGRIVNGQLMSGGVLYVGKNLGAKSSNSS